MNATETGVCRHGHRGYCGFCVAEKAPKCKHGNVFYCGFCEAEKSKTA